MLRASRRLLASTPSTTPPHKRKAIKYNLPTRSRRRAFATTTPTAPLHDPRGSIWRRWDLHVHTPASIRQEYGGPTGWDHYLADLAALPPDIAVLGINDYLFIDGYRRVRDEHERGNLPNLKLILPVIEFRIDKFSGTDSKLRRVNYHVIFSNDLTPDQIQTEFLNTLTADYVLSEHERWNRVVNRDTLEEFGQRVLDNEPALKHANISALEAGFNNLNFSITQIEEKLANTALACKYLTAIGMNEWSDMRWLQSSAEKRSLIERVDFVLTASDTPERCTDARTKLTAQHVNNRLLHASDAHHFTDSDQPNRIGHCHTWIKADTTFAGLRQVRRAPDDRIFLGISPPKVILVHDHPKKFLKQIDVHRNPGSALAEQWFDNTVPLNPDLVAIIGNKGMGKSALTDIIALTSNSDAPPERYGFLTEHKFRDRRENKAKHFTATITWASAETSTPRTLDEHVPEGTIPQVRYIPQHYFEDLCNETSNAALLQRELRGVIFSNLTSQQRGRYTDLDELLTAHTAEAERRIDELRGELRTTNREIVTLERELSTRRRKELEDLLQQQEGALAAHDANKPLPEPPPATPRSTLALDAARQTIDARNAAITQQEHSLQDLYELQIIATNVTARLQTLQDMIARTAASTTDDLQRLGLTFPQLLPTNLTLAPLGESANAIATAIASADARLSTLHEERAAAQRTVVAEQETLDAPARAYQQYLDRLRTWETQRAGITGTTSAPGTIEYLKARLTTTRNAQAERLDTLGAERITITRAIHEQLVRITAFQRTLYGPVADRLASHEIVRAQLNVNFAAKLVDTGLATEFTKRINRTTIGSYREEHAMRDQLVEYDLNATDDVIRFLETTTKRLHHNQFAEAGDIEDVQRQLRKGEDPESIYNYLYSLTYLEPRYALRINDRELAQLTPGERGSLLLVFYLVIDQDDRPLIIDQPEENLDNQSVFELLVPCIREAKERRQLIMVTHNPNLAVVCNAEQVIWCKINKDTDHAVTYTTGSIENPEINKHVVDVLEGTWPAFTDRGGKYHG